MLVHEPDGTTIGMSARQAARNLRARSTASSRNPSLNATCPQQNALVAERTFSLSRSSTLAAASYTSGKNSSARQVEKSCTSFIGPYQDHVQRFRPMHAHHDSLLDVRRAARTRDQRHPMLPQSLRARFG